MLIVAAAMAASAWGSCIERTSSYGDFAAGTMQKCDFISVSGSYYCDYGDGYNFVRCPGLVSGYEFSASSSCGSIQGAQGVGFERCACRSIICSTQAEADSARCALEPTAEGCVVEQDTTLWACSEDMVNGAPVARIYKLECRAQNGVVTSCNGKQDVDIETDGQLTAAYGGTCVQNGYENGVQSGEALKIVRA